MKRESVGEIMVAIDGSYYLQNNQDSDRNPSPELGKEEFIKILMTQLQNQDPLDPMDDKEFISQMATFSTLEQTMNIAGSIDELVQSQQISPVIKYSHMIGKEVIYPIFDEETGHEEGEGTSIVVAVSQEDGWAVLELENGEKIFADTIKHISEPLEGESDNDQNEENVDG